MPDTDKPIILNGLVVSQAIVKNIQQHLHTLPVRPPKLVAVLTADNFASQTYVKRKIKACAEAGITSEVFHLEQAPQGKLQQLIHDLNADPNVDGILIQLPLRNDYDTSSILASVVPEKD